MTSDDLSRTNTLWHGHCRDERLAFLDSSHMHSLNAYRDDLQRESGRDIPNFDPFDGGVSAKLLILLETPAPSQVESHRRLVSIDNPTGTAKNLRNALNEAGILWRKTILWNSVPWVRATKRPRTASQRRDGIDRLARMLPCCLI